MHEKKGKHSMISSRLFQSLSEIRRDEREGCKDAADFKAGNEVWKEMDSSDKEESEEHAETSCQGSLLRHNLHL